jgi:large-conductance mechanosensitive channel
MTAQAGLLRQGCPSVTVVSIFNQVKKESNIMAVLPLRDQSASPLRTTKHPRIVMGEKIQYKQVLSTILAVILVFQMINLIEALLSHSNMDLVTAAIGLGICGLAILFNSLNMFMVASVLLISVVDLGCGLMLLTTPMGLDVANLPVFDVLIVSELIAVSLLPAWSVFIVAGCNITFIIADLLLQPHTPEMHMLLNSTMAYNAVVQPVLLQIVVAAVVYIWVRSALKAIVRADRAEEIAELRRREMERAHELDIGIEHLSEVLNRAANGDRMIRAELHQSNVLWRLGNALNLLLVRLRKALQTEQENKRLRGEIVRLNMTLFEEKRTNQHRIWRASQQNQHGGGPQPE